MPEEAADGALSPVTPGPVTPLPGSDDASGSPAADETEPPLTTTELAHAWQRSELFQKLQAEAQKTTVPALELTSSFAKAQYGSKHARPILATAATILHRREF